MSGSDNHAPVHPAGVVLARRNNAGIHVTLLWAEDTNAVAVLVRDDSTHDQFELSVTNALNVFEHPYAYAAWRGVDYGPPPEGGAVPPRRSWK
jgi:hypothetical protein